jgi:hypothetical protein
MRAAEFFGDIPAPTSFAPSQLFVSLDGAGFRALARVVQRVGVHVFVCGEVAER